MSLCICTQVFKLLRLPYAALAILAASLVSLIAAFVAQHVFDIQPCILCLFQRVPYAVALVLGALALLFRKDEQKIKILFTLIALTLFVNVGIAAFHSGVERQWWAGTNGCDVVPLNGELSREQLLTMAVAQCDEINFDIFGITLANLNVIFCLGLGIFSLVVAFGQRKLDELIARLTPCCCGRCPQP